MTSCQTQGGGRARQNSGLQTITPTLGRVNCKRLHCSVRVERRGIGLLILSLTSLSLSLSFEVHIFSLSHDDLHFLSRFLSRFLSHILSLSLCHSLTLSHPLSLTLSLSLSLSHTHSLSLSLRARARAQSEQTPLEAPRHLLVSFMHACMSLSFYLSLSLSTLERSGVRDLKAAGIPVEHLQRYIHAHRCKYCEHQARITGRLLLANR